MGVLHIILKVGHPKIILTQISKQKILMWFLSHNIPKRNKLAEKISQKKPRIYVKLLIVAAVKISIFGNNSHFEWRPCQTQYWKGTSDPTTIPAKFVLIWFSGFRGEDLNAIFYQNMPNLHNRYKSAERKISQKNLEYIAM